MIEARIECLCSEYTLADLGLTLKKGQVTWLPQVKAAASKDLLLAKRVRAIDLKWVERFQVSKQNNNPNTPPFMRRDLKRAIPEPMEGMSSEMVQATAREAAQSAVAGQMSVMTSHLENVLAKLQAATEAQAMMEDRLKQLQAQGVSTAPVEVAASVPKAATGPQTVFDLEGWEDVELNPVFIPSKIVDNAAKSTMVTQSSEAKSVDGLDETSAALKTLKAKRPKKT